MTKPAAKHVGITMGDPAGIGPEIVAKALSDPKVRTIPALTVIGDKKVFSRYRKRLPANCSFVNLANVQTSKMRLGRPNRHAALASIQYLAKATALVKAGQIQAMVTAPVCKETIDALGERFSGHTEYLAQQFGTKKVEMMFVARALKTVIVTRHIPLRKVPTAISPDKVLATITTTDHALKRLFKIRQPSIAVCGLNPHAGEHGLLGREDDRLILPAIRQARRSGIKADGPLPADTLFYQKNAGRYDAIVAMYHDQGLTPIKALFFEELVNLTIGLPFVRTSPAHGTAFDIAGKNKANPSSMIASILLAANLSS